MRLTRAYFRTSRLPYGGQVADQSHPDDTPRDGRGRWATYLRDLTDRPGWSVKRLATESGVHRSTIFRWLNGNVRNVTMDSVRAIARASGDDEATVTWAAADVLAEGDEGLQAESRRQFAEAIVTARTQRNMTQDELADAADVPRSVILRWEDGDVNRPDPGQVRRVFRALRLDPREAPVLLGYVTRDEIGLPPQPPRVFSPTVEEVIDILEDPAVSDEEKHEWIAFLRYRTNRPTSNPRPRRVV